MKTYYLLSNVNPKGKILWSQEFDDKEKTLKVYESFSENFPKETYKVSRVTLIEEVIAKSDDFKQSKFDF